MRGRILGFPALLSIAALLSACETSQDPADGGFFSGVEGISGGGYQDRVDERETAVAAAEAQNVALSREQAKVTAEIDQLRSELAKLKFAILQQKTSLGPLDAPTAARVDATLNANPGGNTSSARLASLRKAVADARALSADLARLSG